MKFEVLKKDNLKRNIIIGVFVVLIISAVVLNFTRAKYRSTASVPIVDSEVNYVRPDLEIIALYINGVQAEELDSNTNYTLDTTNSTCTYKDGSSIDNLTLSYDSDTKTFTIAPYTTRGTKCYLYFDEVSIRDTLLSYYPNILTREDFSTPVTESTTGTIYQTTDWDGTTYYFAGNPTDNWVYFAGYYWRIIRFNGDGTIRLIYAGTSNTTSGTDDQIGTSAFNEDYNYSYYVGLSYSTTQHGTGTESTILGELNDWYNGLSSANRNYIDSNAGFCSDRNMASGYIWDDQPNSDIYYAAYERVVRSKSPSLACSTSDILNIPVGLITADEVAYAGGVINTSNQSYYLYTGQYYWTMSPYYFYSTGDTGVFMVRPNGGLFFSSVVRSAFGVRPVINLKSTTTISSGNGTAQNPFIVD